MSHYCFMHLLNTDTDNDVWYTSFTIYSAHNHDINVCRIKSARRISHIVCISFSRILVHWISVQKTQTHVFSLQKLTCVFESIEKSHWVLIGCKKDKKMLMCSCQLFRYLSFNIIQYWHWQWLYKFRFKVSR